MTITVVMHRVRCSIASVLCPCCTVQCQVTVLVIFIMGLYGLCVLDIIQCQLSVCKLSVVVSFVCMYRALYACNACQLY